MALRALHSRGMNNDDINAAEKPMTDTIRSSDCLPHANSANQVLLTTCAQLQSLT